MVCGCTVTAAERRMLNCNSRRCVSAPLARFARVSPSRGGDYRLQRESFILPLPEGESRRRREGGAHTPSRIGIEQHAPAAVGWGASQLHSPFTATASDSAGIRAAFVQSV